MSIRAAKLRLPAAWLAALIAALAMLVATAAPAASAGPVASASVFSPSPVRHVRANGIEIGYRTIGRGRPLVLIAGSSGTMSEWDPALISRLANKHRVIVFDNRGVGATSGPVKGLTIEKMADDTAALIARLGLRRPDVLGWSMGGYIAQELAIRHPNSVRRLVLAATDPGSPKAIPTPEWVIKVFENPETTTEDLVSLLFPRAHEAAARAWMARIPRWPELRKEYFYVAPETVAAQNRAEGALWYGRGRGAYADLPRIRHRALVAAGLKDVVVPPRNSRLIAGRLPRAELVTYKDAGHGFLIQHHKAFARKVIRFLAAR